MTKDRRPFIWIVLLDHWKDYNNNEFHSAHATRAGAVAEVRISRESDGKQPYLIERHVLRK